MDKFQKIKEVFSYKSIAFVSNKINGIFKESYGSLDRFIRVCGINTELDFTLNNEDTDLVNSLNKRTVDIDGEGVFSFEYVFKKIIEEIISELNVVFWRGNTKLPDSMCDPLSVVMRSKDSIFFRDNVVNVGSFSSIGLEELLYLSNKVKFSSPKKRTSIFVAVPQSRYNDFHVNTTGYVSEGGLLPDISIIQETKFIQSDKIFACNPSQLKVDITFPPNLIKLCHKYDIKDRKDKFFVEYYYDIDYTVNGKAYYVTKY